MNIHRKYELEFVPTKKFLSADSRSLKMLAGGLIGATAGLLFSLSSSLTPEVGEVISFSNNVEAYVALGTVAGAMLAKLVHFEYFALFAINLEKEDLQKQTVKYSPEKFFPVLGLR